MNGSGHSWSKFWWQDWQNDNALKRCSLAARGLWMAMLCIAHDGEPCGYLRLNGQALTAEDLNDMIAKTTVKEVERLLMELEGRGVFSRADDGAIYSRRMVKDAAATDAGRENAAKRWNGAKPTDPPNGGANREPNEDGSGEPYSKAYREPTRDPYAKKLEAEARSKTPPNPPVTGGATRRRRNSRNGFHDLAREMDAEEGLIVIDGTAEVADLSAFRLQAKAVGHG